jgi:hypothetical protein
MQPHFPYLGHWSSGENLDPCCSGDGDAFVIPLLEALLLSLCSTSMLNRQVLLMSTTSLH